MEANREEFATHCDWCQLRVISFVEAPSLIEVAISAWHVTVDRICLECYADLLGLQARRSIARLPASSQEV